MTFPTDSDVKHASEAYRWIEERISVTGIDAGTMFTCGLRPIDGYGDPAPFADAEGFVTSDGREIWLYDGAEPLMLSCGYVQIWSDGEVTGGPVPFWVDGDGQIDGPAQ